MKTVVNLRAVKAPGLEVPDLLAAQADEVLRFARARNIAAAMARLPVESVILEGEAVCLLEDGRRDFHALRSRHAAETRA